MAGINLFTNNAATTLATGINSSVTSLTVASATGGLFPNPTAGQYFYCTLSNSAGTTIEIVKVTARSGDILTIVRGQDNTIGAAFTAGAKVELRLVNASLQNFPQLDSTNTFSQTQTFVTPILGTPSSGTLTSCTGLPLTTGVTGTLPVANGGTGVTTSTGSGANVLATSPTLVTPVLGTPTSGNFSTGTFTWPTFNQNTTGSAATFTSTSQNSQFNSVGVGTAASATAGEIRATNNVTAYYSDARLKDFKGKIPNALDKVHALNGYYFTENAKAKELGYNNDKQQVGVSAQEVEAVLPEVVTEAPISAEYKTVYYDKLVPLLIEAIKELSEKIKILEVK